MRLDYSTVNWEIMEAAGSFFYVKFNLNDKKMG